MNYTMNLPRYARAAAGLAYLCVMSAGCSKSVKPTEPAVQTSESIMPSNLPVPVASTPTTYSISEIDSKTPVLPVKKKVRVVKNKPLEARVSSTIVVSSENNQPTSMGRYACRLVGGIGVLIFGLMLFYASRRKQEPPQPPQGLNGGQ